MDGANNDPVQLRALPTEELVRLGDQSLIDHLTHQAQRARAKHGPLCPEKLGCLLADPECVRYPTRLAFEFGEMAMHQFAQPDFDHLGSDQEGRVLYLRPELENHPELVVLAVAYMLPVINYGDVIQDDHCLLYGSQFLGLTQEEFYDRICALADLTGSEVRYRDRTAGARS
jgi:hypothetical protein